MSAYKNRLAGYFILGLALALAIPPWFSPDRKKEWLTQDGVFLSALALSPQGLGPACGDKVPVLEASEMAGYPDLAKAVEQLGSPRAIGARLYFRSAEPKALARSLDRDKAPKFCFSLEGETYLLRPRQKDSALQSSLVRVGTSGPAAFAEQTLNARELAKYPYLKLYLDGLTDQAENYNKRNQEIKGLRDKLLADQKKKPATEMDKALGAFEEIETKHQLRTRQWEVLSDRIGHDRFYLEVRSPARPQEWRPLLERLSIGTGQGSVRTPDHLVNISVREHSEWVVTEITALSLFRKIGGPLLFIFGLWLLRRGYTTVPGIRINPGWVPVFADTVFIIALGVGFLGPLDFVLEKWLGLLPLLEEALQFTFSVMLIPALFIFSWMAANMGGQSLEVNPEGIIWHGPGPDRYMAWEAITGLDLRTSHVMVGRVGVLMPRKLQTKLVFKLGEEDQQELFEPGTRARKEAVLKALLKHAPERLREDLERVGEGWL